MWCVKVRGKEQAQKVIIWASTPICFGLSADHILSGGLHMCGRGEEVKAVYLAWLSVLSVVGTKCKSFGMPDLACNMLLEQHKDEALISAPWKGLWP